MRKERKAKSIIFIFLCSCIFMFGYGCAATTEVKKTVLTPASQTPIVEKITPKIIHWPDKIELKARLVDEKSGVIYDVTYEYFKNNDYLTENIACLTLSPKNTDDKLRSETFINGFDKVSKVKIWGVGNFDCPFDYSKTSGSVCQEAENKYTDFCAPNKMNCWGIVVDIILKDAADWL